jgi:plasmid stabilization system protein ParE
MEFTNKSRSTIGEPQARSFDGSGRQPIAREVPRLGRSTDMAGVRVFPIVPFPYLIYYRVTDHALEIVHVRHGRRDAPKPGDLR